MLIWDTLFRKSGYYYRANLFEQDDFTTGTTSSGQIGKLGWNSSGTISQGAGTQDHPGQVFISTGASQGTVARVNQFGTVVFLISQTHGILWVAKMGQVDAFTDVRYGASDGWTANPPTNGIFFERLAADTNWFAVCRSGGVQTRTDTGVAFSTNWITLEYRRDASSVAFFVNGSLVATITTNIPVAGGAFGCHIVNGEALAKTMNVDYSEYYIRGLVR